MKLFIVALIAVCFAGFLPMNANATHIGVFEAGIANTSAQDFYAAQAKAVHADTVRLDFTIYENFQKNSLYKGSLAALISEMNAFYSQGLRITLTVTGTECGNYYSCPAFPAKGEFGNFMQGLLNDLGANCEKDSNCPLNQIDAIEVWNEWDKSYGYSPHNTPYQPAQYAELLYEAHTAIKAIRPDIKVITGSVVMNDEYKITQLAEMGALKYADLVGYHPYVSNVPDLKSRILKAQAAVEAGGASLSLALTEWGCASWQTCSNWGQIFPECLATIVDLNVYEADYFILAQPPNTASMNQYALLIDYTSSGARTKGALYNIFKNAAAEYEGTSEPSYVWISPTTVVANCGIPESTPVQCVYAPKTISSTEFSEPTFKFISSPDAKLCVGSGKGITYGLYNNHDTWQIWTSRGCVATFELTFDW